MIVAHFKDVAEQRKSDENGNKLKKEMGQGEPGTRAVGGDDNVSTSESDEDEYEEAKGDADTDSVEK